MAGEVHKGRCLCGKVSFTVEPENSEVGACHCSMCRRWSGGPFMVVDCKSTLRIDDGAPLGLYQSSDWAERGFCRECGSTLFYRLKDNGQAYVSVESIDGLEDVSLTGEVFIDEKPGYYAFAQKTHQMTGEQVFALFAGQDD
jgi:hypothetical protein